MRFNLFIWAVVAALPCQALVVIDSTLASSCIYYMNTFDWGCGAGTGMTAYKCRCKNLAYLGSVVNCFMDQNDDEGLQEHAMRHLSGRCDSKAGIDISVEQMKGWYVNSSSYAEYPIADDYDLEVTHVLKTNTSEWEYYHKSFKDFAFEVEKSQWFGWGLVFYWCLVLLIATIFNWFPSLNTHYLKRNLTASALIGRHHDTMYKLFGIFPIQAPAKLETLIVLGFIVQTLITASVGYTLSLPNAFINNRWYMNLDLISYRTDMMAISLFPVIYLFAMRNNPLIYITGISFTTFNRFHKWCAIVMVCLSFVHSIIWTVDAIKDGGYMVWVMDAYFQFGIAAMVISALLIAHSPKVVRDCAYETFLILHKLFNVFFIVCMYYHLNTLGWLNWVWAMVGLWSAERAARVVRILACGGVQVATVQKSGITDLIKLTVKKPFAMRNFKPGSFCYVYFLSPWYMGFQSHPFTIVASPASDEDQLNIYIRAKKGITRDVLQKIIMSDNLETQIKVMIEGPYGEAWNHKVPEGNVLGLAGGVGIVSVFPHLAESLAQAKSVGLYWSVSDLQDVRWFQDELKWLARKGCTVSVYVTRQVVEKEATVSEFDDDTGSIKFVSLESRLDLPASIAEYSKRDPGVDLDLVVCGPASFNDDARFGFLQALDHCKAINYHSESFTW